MRRVSYRSVLERAVNLAGFSVDTLTSTPKAQFNAKINARLGDYWQKAWFPETMRSELRYYRDAWTAKVYVSGSEVYHASTAKYWINTSTAAATDLPGTSSKWTELTDLDAYISLDQANLTPIGEVRGVYLDDPLTTDRPRRVPFILGENGIQIPGQDAPASLYVWYRIRVPDFRGADYAADVAYSLGVTRYYANSATADFEGDFWTTVSATTASESPESTPDKWTRLEFPAWARECVAHGAYADWLRLDGAADLALAESDVADGKFTTEVIKLAGQGQYLLSRTG